MKKWFCVMVLLIIAVLALPAYASIYTCSGTVTSVAVSSAYSAVFVSGAGGLSTVAICSLDGSPGPFSANACKGILATLLSAKLSGQSVTIYFSDNLTCATQPSSGSPANSTAFSVFAN